jgi:alpha-1,2-mannosyltransferase
MYSPRRSWRATTVVALVVVASIRILGAFLTCAQDCDETYNYVEPLHRLLYGFGMQTWEYAPEFALRSYTFLLPSLCVASLSSALGGGKLAAWMSVRIFWSLLCAAAEVHLYSAARSRFSARVGCLYLLMSATSAGVFVAAPALLPSSVCMIAAASAHAFWLQRRWYMAVFLSCLCVACTGWPFVSLLFIPLGLSSLWMVSQTKLGGLLSALRLCIWAALCLLSMGAFAAVVDSWYYGRWTSPNVNIVRYNVFPEETGGGDELYGTEPWTYYAKNLVLNTGLSCVLAAALPGALVVAFMLDRSRAISSDSDPKSVLKATLSHARSQLLSALPAVMWLAVMFAKPHKEERFLYPAYPFIFLAAAHTIHCLERCGKGSLFVRMGASATLLASVLLGLFRCSALVQLYSQPCHLYRYMSSTLDVGHQAAICVGGQWHRFPGSFHLPHEGVQLEFVKSSFGGQLPQPFPPGPLGTRAEPLQPFNDKNAEEESRYADISSCDYLVLDNDELGVVQRSCQSVHSLKLLDSAASHWLARAFYVPRLSEPYLVFGTLGVYRCVNEGASPVIG